MNNLILTAIMPHPPIVIPEIGKGHLSKVIKTAESMELISRQIVELEPDSIVFITPHSVFDPYYFSVFTSEHLKSDFSNFGAKNIDFSFKNDIDFIQNLEKDLSENNIKINKIPEHFALDHGTYVPLYYIKKAGYNGEISTINYCALDKNIHLNFGKSIKKAMETSDKKYVFIASGDLSHRLTKDAPAGFEPEAKNFDESICKNIKEGNYQNIINLDQGLRQTAGECGFNSLMVAFGLIDSTPVNNKILSYEAPFGVGYLVATL